MTDKSYQVMIDATNELPEHLAGQVKMIPMEILIGDKTVLYGCDWDEQQMRDFYHYLRNGGQSSTSQISPFALEQAFEPILREGQDILYLCFSSGLSNTHASAVLTAQALTARYPGRVIEVVDTLLASCGETMLLEYALRNRDAGMTATQNACMLEARVQEIAVWFTVEDLMFLQRGGRVSKVAAILGTTLRIMPVLHIDDAGKLTIVDKIQGRKSAIKALIRRVEKTLHPDADTIYLIHGDAYEDVALVERLVRHAFPGIERVVKHSLGPVIAAHAGPSTLGIAYRATEK